MTTPGQTREFDGKAVVVTGAFGGIAPTVARIFAAAGARIVVGESPRHEPASADGLPAGCKRLPFDPADISGIRAFFDSCEAVIGELDIVVVPGQSVTAAPALQMTPEVFKSVIDEELLGAGLLMQEAARRMAARGRGRIIAFVSMSGKTGVHRGVAPSAAAKGGLITFSRVLAAEMAPFGVTVNTIATSLFEPQVASMSEDRRREHIAGIPVGRFGRADEAAQACMYLASDAAGFVTGETLNMSGGRFMD